MKNCLQFQIWQQHRNKGPKSDNKKKSWLPFLGQFLISGSCNKQKRSLVRVWHLFPARDRACALNKISQCHWVLEATWISVVVMLKFKLKEVRSPAYFTVASLFFGKSRVEGDSLGTEVRHLANFPGVPRSVFDCRLELLWTFAAPLQSVWDQRRLPFCRRRVKHSLRLSDNNQPASPLLYMPNYVISDTFRLWQFGKIRARRIHIQCIYAATAPFKIKYPRGQCVL